MTITVWAIVAVQAQHSLIYTPVAKGEVTIRTAIKFSKAEDSPLLTSYTTIKKFPSHNLSFPLKIKGLGVRG